MTTDELIKELDHATDVISQQQNDLVKLHRANQVKSVQVIEANNDRISAENEIGVRDEMLIARDNLNKSDLIYMFALGLFAGYASVLIWTVFQ